MNDVLNVINYSLLPYPSRDFSVIASQRIGGNADQAITAVDASRAVLPVLKPVYDVGFDDKRTGQGHEINALL